MTQTVARDAQLRERFRFMLENAGYCTPPGRAVCALELARGEKLLAEAVEAGSASVEWVDDPEPYEYGCDDPRWVTEQFESNSWTGPFGCVIRAYETDGSLLAEASLFGVVVGPTNLSDPYCRVVEAELAEQLRDELQQALGDHRDLADDLRRVVRPLAERI